MDQTIWLQSVNYPDRFFYSSISESCELLPGGEEATSTYLVTPGLSSTVSGVSLRHLYRPTHYITHVNAVIKMVDHAAGDEALAVDATWTIGEGLMTDESGDTVSFFHSNGQIMRHAGFVLRLNSLDGSNPDGTDSSALLRNDASWNVQIHSESFKLSSILP